uniref:Uncharacterized protein n=1 Tax=Cacopsylla melanoneura TaxID=428564 RepID=A0A8D8Q6W1_9HEMI
MDQMFILLVQLDPIIVFPKYHPNFQIYFLRLFQRILHISVSSHHHKVFSLLLFSSFFLLQLFLFLFFVPPFLPDHFVFLIPSWFLLLFSSMLPSFPFLFVFCRYSQISLAVPNTFSFLRLVLLVLSYCHYLW